MKKRILTRSYYQIPTVRCRLCGALRLDDGLACICHAYQNASIRMVEGRLVDVRYLGSTNRYEGPQPK